VLADSKKLKGLFFEVWEFADSFAVDGVALGLTIGCFSWEELPLFTLLDMKRL
jgi:hypothetical protein